MDEMQIQAVASIVSDLGIVGLALAWIYSLNRLLMLERDDRKEAQSLVNEDWKADKQSGRVPTLSQPRPLSK